MAFESERRKAKLSDVASFQEGYVNPPQSKNEYFDGDIKWLRAVDLNNARVHSTSRTLTLEGFRSAGKSAVLFSPGTLAISKSGTIGRLGILEDYMCGNRAVINIRPTEVVDTRFIFYSLMMARDRIQTLAEGSVQKNLYVSAIGSLDIELPDLREQRAIAETIGTLDDRIDLLSQTNATLETTAQALFKSWFVDFDPVRAKAEGRESEGMDPDTAALFPSAFEDSELGLIPKGWRVGRLGELCQNIRAQAKPETLDASTPYIGLEHMPRGSIALTNAGTVDGLASGKFWYATNDVLFGKLRPYFHKVGIASHTGVCSTDILVIRAGDQAWFGYTAMHLSSEAIIAYATRLSNGAKMPRSSWKDIAGFKVVIPTEQVAEAFNGMIRSFIGRIHTNIEVGRSLAGLRDSLLPRLISGRLRLPEAEEAGEDALA